VWHKNDQLCLWVTQKKLKKSGHGHYLKHLLCIQNWSSTPERQDPIGKSSHHKSHSPLPHMAPCLINSILTWKGGTFYAPNINQPSTQKPDNWIELEEHGTMPENSPQASTNSTVSTRLTTILRHASETVVPSGMVSTLDSRGRKRRKTEAFGEGARRGWQAGGHGERKGDTCVLRPAPRACRPSMRNLGIITSPTLCFKKLTFWTRQLYKYHGQEALDPSYIMILNFDDGW
jgi:hypothetical protein